MKTKVLVIGSGPFVKRGVESYLLSLYKYIDHNMIKMDFLTPYTCDNALFFEATKEYEDTVVELGIKRNKILFPMRFFIRIYSYLKKNKYDTVYINTGNIIPMSIAVCAAVTAKVPKRVVHSHNGGVDTIKNRISKRLFSPFLKYLPTEYLACSELAARFVFPSNCLKKTTIIPNGIELQRYAYNSDSRKYIRDKMNIADYCVVGHIGAFIEQKNHVFIIDIIKNISQLNLKVKFILIGEGPKLELIKKAVKENGVDSYVIFAGVTNEVEKWLSAFDIFILPSKYEGLPVCAIEAQASGLPCLLSDNITDEIELTNNITFLPIDRGGMLWADEIHKLSMNERIAQNKIEKLENFDVKRSAKIVEIKLISE